MSLQRWEFEHRDADSQGEGCAKTDRDSSDELEASLLQGLWQQPELEETSKDFLLESSEEARPC